MKTRRVKFSQSDREMAPLNSVLRLLTNRAFNVQIKLAALEVMRVETETETQTELHFHLHCWPALLRNDAKEEELGDLLERDFTGRKEGRKKTHFLFNSYVQRKVEDQKERKKKREIFFFCIQHLTFAFYLTTFTASLSSSSSSWSHINIPYVC